MFIVVSVGRDDLDVFDRLNLFRWMGNIVEIRFEYSEI